MADKLYKVNEAITVDFQATKDSASATLNVYDETGTLDEDKSGAMAQIGATGIWRKLFTPDVQGSWVVQAIDNKGGKAVKSYSVGGYNVDSVGTGVAAVDSQATATDVKVVAVDSQATATDTKVVAVDSQVTATDMKVVALDSQFAVDIPSIDSQVTIIDTNITALDSQVTVVEEKIDLLASPPCIG